jgi:hypothetical protein
MHALETSQFNTLILTRTYRHVPLGFPGSHFSPAPSAIVKYQLSFKINDGSRMEAWSSEHRREAERDCC